MPLEKGAKPGSKGFGRNIATEVKAGKSPAQSAAIAYSEARDCYDSSRVKVSLHDAYERPERYKHLTSEQVAEIYKLQNKILRAFASSPMQLELKAQLAALEKRYGVHDRTIDTGRVKVTVHDAPDKRLYSARYKYNASASERASGSIDATIFLEKSGGYVAWTKTWEGPLRYDLPAAQADLRDKIGSIQRV